jgi:hypothetical protein
MTAMKMMETLLKRWREMTSNKINKNNNRIEEEEEKEPRMQEINQQLKLNTSLPEDG